MQQPCKLYIVRHGESTANRDQLVGGHSDTALSSKGEAQALETKQLLNGIHFDAVYSSDLQRAIRTAELISGKSVDKNNQLYNLRERNFGKLEGSPLAEWSRLDEAFTQKYAKRPFEERSKHDYADFIESDAALCDRSMAALRDIAGRHRGQTVVVVTHGGCIRVLLMKLGFIWFMGAGSFKNAGYVELSCDGNEFVIDKVVGVERTEGAE